MKKFIVMVLLISIFMPIPNCKAYEIPSALNNKSLSPDKTIKAKNVVMISYADSVSSKTHNGTEIYNINKLNDFMENVKQGKKDTIRIVKYTRDKTLTWVNKLYDLNYNGENIIYIEYDAYSNPNSFIPSQPLIFYNVIKREYTESIWYGICYSNSKKDCASLISFYKSSIVDGEE